MRARERKIGLQIVHYRTGQPLAEAMGARPCRRCFPGEPS